MNQQFKKSYDNFESEALKYRSRINSVQFQGEELREYLQREMLHYTKWRKSFMDNLGFLGKKMTANEKIVHREYVLKSEGCKIFQEAPFCWRIVQRPEGYVGDAKMMEIIYNANFEGETAWGNLVHKEATNFLACEAVRNRIQYIKKKIYETGEGAKILNLAAGSGKEIKEFVEENTNTKRHFLALDHDITTIRNFDINKPNVKYALANAFHFIKGKNRILYPKKKYLHSLNPKKSFKGLNLFSSVFKYSFSSLRSNSYQLVYSTGLFDYIQDFQNKEKGAKKLTSFLFDKVESGGKLIIGNFNNSIPLDNYFSMEFLTNWILHYREDYELLNFADGIDQKKIKRMFVEKEPTGINSFLIIEKQ